MGGENPMGVLNNLGGSAISGAYLGVTVVFAVVVYSWVRGSGLPVVGGTGGADVFGGN